MNSASLTCFGPTVANDPVYVAYHDEEWGRRLEGESAMFERISLEAFQVGLSWRTILHKRDAFREVFADFDTATVAGYGEAEIEAACADARIVRNRGKITATINAARVVERMHDRGESLSDLVWSFAPAGHARPEPGKFPAQTRESVELAKELRRLGFRFIGPVNMYAAMQACGIVNDHAIGCVIGDEIDRVPAVRPCEHRRRPPGMWFAFHSRR